MYLASNQKVLIYTTHQNSNRQLLLGQAKQLKQ